MWQSIISNICTPFPQNSSLVCHVRPTWFPTSTTSILTLFHYTIHPSCISLHSFGKKGSQTLRNTDSKHNHIRTVTCINVRDGFMINIQATTTKSISTQEVNQGTVSKKDGAWKEPNIAIVFHNTKYIKLILKWREHIFNMIHVASKWDIKNEKSPPWRWERDLCSPFPV